MRRQETSSSTAMLASPSHFNAASLTFTIQTDASVAPRRLLASDAMATQPARDSGCSRQYQPAWASISTSQPAAIVAAGAASSSSDQVEGSKEATPLEPLPVGMVEGAQKKPYVWDAAKGRLRAVDPCELEERRGGVGASSERYGRSLLGHWHRIGHDLSNAFFPDPLNVTPDYWEFARWKAVHRLFSSMSSVFATQSLLAAVGVGARRALPAAAAINWVLKDGLGRLGRLTVATRFGESFDSDLKRFRFTTSVLYCAALSLEYLTPLFPQHFLLMASLANVGKSVGLTTFIATQPAFHRSFARGENLADISAKAQAQQMVMDNIGLATAVALTHACSKSPAARRALPLVAFPILAVGDLYSIYRELRSIHLRTLNKERAEIIAEHWLRTGEVPSPLQVSDEERLILPARIASGCLPLTIGPLHDAVRSRQDLDALLAHGRNDRYLLTYEPPCQPASMADSSTSSSQQKQKQQQLPQQHNSLGNGGDSQHSSLGSGSSGSSSSSSLQTSGSKAGSGGLLQALSSLWQGSQRQGAVQLALRRDASHIDILQAILQVAYLRQTLQQAPLAATSTSSTSSLVASSSGGGGGGGRSRAAEASGSEDCCSTCKDAAREHVLRESRRRAQSSLQPFLRELQEHGWQAAPFMLSSIEKRGYVIMA